MPGSTSWTAIHRGAPSRAIPPWIRSTSRNPHLNRTRKQLGLGPPTGLDLPYEAGGLIPTNDGLTCVFISTTPERFRREIQGDLTGAFSRFLRRLSPEMAQRVKNGEQVGRLRGFTGISGYLRRPWGPGWALVGDASGSLVDWFCYGDHEGECNG